MASSRPAPPHPSKPLDLEVTVISAKHLKNVNWLHGDLKPYAVVHLDFDPDRRAATKPDDSGSTKPVWNETLTLTIPYLDSPPLHLLLAIDIYHSKPSETPKPLVASVRAPLKDLIDGVYPGASAVKTLELRRPSGRPQGKLRIKVAVRERPEPSYRAPPPPSAYYYSSAPPPPVRDYHSFSPSPPPASPYSNPMPSYNPSGSYPDSYYSSAAPAPAPAPGYYSSAAPTGYYSAPPMSAPAPSRLQYDRASGYGFPSAPVDYVPSMGPSPYEQKAKGTRMGMGAGLAVGAVTGALGALALEEGLKHEEERISERVENDRAAREDYTDYRADY